MKKIWIIVTCILLLVAILTTVFVMKYIPIWKQAKYEKVIEDYYELQGNKVNAANHYSKKVTMIELIANPEKYDGMFVRVMGVGHIQTDSNDYGDALFFSKEEYEMHTGNSLELELGPRAMPREEARAYNGKYVIVEGFFEKPLESMESADRGRIVRVSRYALWEDRHAG